MELPNLSFKKLSLRKAISSCMRESFDVEILRGLSSYILARGVITSSYKYFLQLHRVPMLLANSIGHEVVKNRQGRPVRQNGRLVRRPVRRNDRLARRPVRHNNEYARTTGSPERLVRQTTGSQERPVRQASGSPERFARQIDQFARTTGLLEGPVGSREGGRRPTRP